MSEAASFSETTDTVTAITLLIRIFFLQTLQPADYLLQWEIDVRRFDRARNLRAGQWAMDCRHCAGAVGLIRYEQMEGGLITLHRGRHSLEQDIAHSRLESCCSLWNGF